MALFNIKFHIKTDQKHDTSVNVSKAAQRTRLSAKPTKTKQQRRSKNNILGVLSVRQIQKRLHSNSTLHLAETFSLDRRVGKENEHYNVPSSTKGTTNKEISIQTRWAERVFTYIMRNSYFHEGKAPRRWPMPYPNNPQRAITSPLAVYQSPKRTGCSRRVYHMLVISITPGSEHASAAPPA